MNAWSDNKFLSGRPTVTFLPLERHRLFGWYRLAGEQTARHMCMDDLPLGWLSDSETAGD